MKKIYDTFANFFYYLFAILFGMPGVAMALPFKKFKFNYEDDFKNAFKDSYMGLGLIFWLIIAFIYDGLSR